MSKETGQKRGRESSRAKSSGRLGRRKGGTVRCPKGGIAPACGSKLLFRSVMIRSVRMHLFSQNAWRTALSDASSLSKYLRPLLFDKSYLIFFFSRKLSERKNLTNTFSTRECVCASVLAVITCSAACSVKFRRARLSALRQVLVIVQFCCARSNSTASCAFVCARSNSFLFSRNDVSFC